MFFKERTKEPIFRLFPRPAEYSLDDEAFCFRILFLHVPFDSFDSILNENESAVDTLRAKYDLLSAETKEYINRTINFQNAQAAMFASLSNPEENEDQADYEDDYEEENFDPTSFEGCNSSSLTDFNSLVESSSTKKDSGSKSTYSFQEIIRATAWIKVTEEKLHETRTAQLFNLYNRPTKEREELFNQLQMNVKQFDFKQRLVYEIFKYHFASMRAGISVDPIRMIVTGILVLLRIFRFHGSFFLCLTFFR